VPRSAGYFGHDDRAESDWQSDRKRSRGFVKREDQPWRHDKFFDEVAQDDAASKAKAPGEHLRDNEPVPPLTHAEKAEASQEDSQNQSDTGDRSGGNESPTRDSLLDEVV